MANDKLVNKDNNKLCFKNIKVDKIEKNEQYLFVILGNGQKILTDGNKMYNVSDYEHFEKVMIMNGKKLGVFKNYSELYLVDLEKNEILFKEECYAISKGDERVLDVIMYGSEGHKMYDIENKRYITVPENYSFEESLGNGLYLFEESIYHRKSYSDYERLIIDIDGNIVLNNIKGFVCYKENHLIIHGQDSLMIAKMDNAQIINVNILKKDDKFLTVPKYYENIMLIEKNCVKLVDVNFKEIKKIEIEGLDCVLDDEWIGEIVKILVPYEENGKKINKHLFVNLNNNKIISHVRIDGFPYWNPTTYIGRDTTKEDNTEYYFYNKDFEFITKIKAEIYENIDSERSDLFFVWVRENDVRKKYLLNCKDGILKEVDYDYIFYPLSNTYGYGVNGREGTLDFFDKDFNVVVENFDYEKYNLSLAENEFNYFILNDYICVIKHVVDDYGRSQFRNIIQNKSGEVILDSFKHRCFPLGNVIQITQDGKSKFFNTLNGEMGDLSLQLPVDKKGMIKFDREMRLENVLSVQSSSKLLPKDNKKSKR